MELKMRSGDYVKNICHELESVSGTEEAVQRIMMKLKGRRGGFALLPEYGSRLYTLGGIRPGQRETMARLYIAEALEGEGAILEELQLRDADGILNVEISLRLGSETIRVTTEI